MNGDSVGSFIENAKVNAWKTIITLFGIIVYVGGVIYAEVHGYSMLTRGIDPEMQIWATLGVVSLGITALVLPLGLHFKFFGTLERIWAFVFYALDFGLMVFNVVIDYNIRAAGGVEKLPGWGQSYLVYGVPAVPVLITAMWAVLFLLDPAAQEKVASETLKAGTRATLQKKISMAAKGVDINGEVEAAAVEMVRELVGATLGGALNDARRLTGKKNPAQARNQVIDLNTQSQPPNYTQPSPTLSDKTQLPPPPLGYDYEQMPLQGGGFIWVLVANTPMQQPAPVVVQPVSFSMNGSASKNGLAGPV